MFWHIFILLLTAQKVKNQKKKLLYFPQEDSSNISFDHQKLFFIHEECEEMGKGGLEACKKGGGGEI
jgi:hypothetical protein